ncbi:MAG: type II secretion system protein [Firmicutes bacterium]|nr:type II secretion system protein [Bacillota bacterium]
MNKKAFTLVELLAVIVILSIMLMIAIPAVSHYISVAKKQSYLVLMQEYASVAKGLLTLEAFKQPVEKNDVTIVSLDLLPMDKDKFVSPFGGRLITNKNYVAIINTGTLNKPSYRYYICSQDENGYAIPLKEANLLEISDVLKNAKDTMEVTIQALCGTATGNNTVLSFIKGLESVQPKENNQILDWNATIYSSQNCSD